MMEDSKTILEDLSYAIGSTSRRGLEVIKKSACADTYKQIGKNLEAFSNEIEQGWKNPKDLLEVNIKTTIGNSSGGLIIGSATRYSADWLKKTYKVTSYYLGKGYKKGRVASLIAVWKAENPNAPETEKTDAINQIKSLYKL